MNRTTRVSASGPFGVPKGITSLRDALKTSPVLKRHAEIMGRLAAATRPLEEVGAAWERAFAPIFASARRYEKAFHETVARVEAHARPIREAMARVEATRPNLVFDVRLPPGVRL